MDAGSNTMLSSLAPMPRSSSRSRQGGRSPRTLASRRAWVPRAAPRVADKVAGPRKTVTACPHARSALAVSATNAAVRSSSKGSRNSIDAYWLSSLLLGRHQRRPSVFFVRHEHLLDDAADPVDTSKGLVALLPCARVPPSPAVDRVDRRDPDNERPAAIAGWYGRVSECDAGASPRRDRTVNAPEHILDGGAGRVILHRGRWRGSVFGSWVAYSSRVQQAAPALPAPRLRRCSPTSPCGQDVPMHATR